MRGSHRGRSRANTEPDLPKVGGGGSGGGPPAPEWLDEIARQEWDRVAPDLVRLGVVRAADLPTLEAYCQAYSRWRSAELELRDGLTVEVGEKGYRQQRPQVAIARAERKAMLQFARELGLTPASRSSVEAVGPGDDAEAEGLLG